MNRDDNNPKIGKGSYALTSQPPLLSHKIQSIWHKKEGVSWKSYKKEYKDLGYKLVSAKKYTGTYSCGGVITKAPCRECKWKKENNYISDEEINRMLNANLDYMNKRERLRFRQGVYWALNKLNKEG